MTPSGATIDLDALQADVNKMSEADLIKEVLDLRTRQRVQQKKNQNSDKQKEYRLKRAQEQKLMIARAKELGLYDQIVKQAKVEADKKLEAVAKTAGTEAALEDLEDENDDEDKAA